MYKKIVLCPLIVLLITTISIAQILDLQAALNLSIDNHADAPKNREKIQNKIDEGAPTKIWFLSGSPSNLKPYLIDSTIIIKDGGRSIWGLGARNGFGGVHAKYGTYLCLRANVFGSDIQCTANNNILTIQNRTMLPHDKYNSLLINNKWYTIVDVTSNNTVVVDRNLPTNGPITGWYCPSLIQDRGVGNEIKGIGFLGARLVSDTKRVPIGYHVVTAQQSLTSEDKGIPTGKVSITNCAWDSFHVGLLFGAGLAGFEENVNNWYGRDWQNADESYFENLYFRNIHTVFAARCRQSVDFLFNRIQISNLDNTVFWLDAGGKLQANTIAIQGNRLNSRQRVLHLGKWVTGGRSGHDPILIQNVTFDGGNSTRNPQLITTDWAGITRTIRVEFNGGLINRATSNDNLPLVDIQSRCFLTLRNIAGIFANSIRLNYGNGPADKPIVVLDCCSLDTEDVEDVIDEDYCPAGITVVFRNCTTSRGKMITKNYLTF